MTFEQLNLIPALLRAVQEKGYTAPTPIQAQAIPPALDGRDVLGCAQTGTGKTAAFALPILQRLWKPEHARGPRPVLALVLAPTRELATQIDESFRAYGKHSGLKSTVIFGGVGYDKQRKALLQGVDIVVATPGRLLDLMKERAVRFDGLRALVLDEADRMLDMGFLPDVKRVLAALPRQKQTMCFSATMPPEIQRLVDGILHSPAKVAVAPVATTAEKVEQAVYFVDKNRKAELLIGLLKQPEVTRALVFTRTKRGANRLAEKLSGAGLRA
ncbi:MAG: DEAD/DEAH box helicase, partial [Planctomycetes bacterium]|nr:DEAD/DEAH box helicase [Planctomycetota bacterium]